MSAHTLADEMGRYAIDAARVQVLVHLIAVELSRLHDRGVSHPNLCAKNVRIVDDTVELIGVDDPISKSPPYAAPETIANGELTNRSNFYSLAIMLRELVDGRAKLAAKAETFVAACSDPARQPRNASAVIAMLADFGWTSGVTPPWRKAFTARDAKEAKLLAALQHDLRDQGAKDVYADWLEENDFDARARFLRTGQASTDDDAPWRALFADAPIVACSDGRCPGVWNKLPRGALDNHRQCSTCTQDVGYCASYVEVSARGHRNERMAVDAVLPVNHVRAMFHAPVQYLGNAPVFTNPPMPRISMPPMDYTVDPISPTPMQPMPPMMPPLDEMPYPNNPPPPRPRRWWEFWKR